jgi:hypothetical protein
MVRLDLLRNCVRILFGLCLLVLSLLVQADGLSDLRAALKQLQTSDPVAVDVEFKLFGRSGENHELVDREGLLNLRLQDGKQGLQVVYSPETIALLHREELAKIADENVKNSALNAVGQFDYWEWRELIYPAAQLELAIASYKFVGEKNDVFDGKPARLLTFSLPQEKIDKSFRKYVKKHNHKFKLWINDKGVPLASQLTEKGSGRIFLVVGFKFKNTVAMRYQQQGNRLITVHREVQDESSGATMQSQRHFVSRVIAVDNSTGAISSANKAGNPASSP